nr:hypothetical protein [Pandoravirus massiliensis]
MSRGRRTTIAPILILDDDDNDDDKHVRIVRNRDPPPPGPATPYAGGAIVYSPVLPHGFAARLGPGPVDATTAARAAFSMACLRSSGPICRNVLGPLAHTLGRYFAGGGCISVATHTGAPRDYKSVESILRWRRPAARAGEGDRAARRWLASCAIAQADSVRWHPRCFVPCDSALDAVYLYLADAAAPASLLHATCGEMCSWLARSDGVLACLKWAMTYASTGNVVCPINLDRLVLAFDALRRRALQKAGATYDADCSDDNNNDPRRTAAATCDVETIGCGCPLAYVCTAWGPDRSVGAWQRSALNAIAFVASAPAVNSTFMPLGYRPSLVTWNGMAAPHGSLGVGVDLLTPGTGGDATDHLDDGQQQQQRRRRRRQEQPKSAMDKQATEIVQCPYSMSINIGIDHHPRHHHPHPHTQHPGGAIARQSITDITNDGTIDQAPSNKRRRLSGDDDGPPAAARDPDTADGGVDDIGGDDFWQWISQQFSTEIEPPF